MVRVASGLDIGSKVIAVFGPRKGSLDSPKTRREKSQTLIETRFGAAREQLPSALQTRFVRLMLRSVPMRHLKKFSTNPV